MSETDPELVSLNALVVDDSRVMRNMIMQALQAAEIAARPLPEAAAVVDPG